MDKETNQKAENEKNFRKRIRMFCERTTIHAVPNIVTNDFLPLKVMWTLCLVASISFCVKILRTSINDYFLYKVLTNYEIIKEPSMHFPSVVICNLDPYDMTKNITSLNDSFRLSDQEVELFRNDSKLMFENARKKFLNQSESFLRSKRVTLDDMLVNCFFNDVACQISDFELIENEEYGNCYAFNSRLNSDSGQSLSIPDESEPSSSNSDKSSTNMNGAKLTLELFIGTGESSSPASMRTGAIVFIKNQTGFIDNKNELGIELAPGTLTNIALNRMVISKLSSPYNDCVNKFDDENFSSDLHELTYEHLSYYNRHVCNHFCYNRLLSNMCHCYDPQVMNLTVFDEDDNIRYNTESSIPFCTASNDTEKQRLQMECRNELKSKFFENTYQATCESLCPLECETITYKPSLSVSQFPSSFYELILKNNENLLKILSTRSDKRLESIDMRSSLLSFSVYFESDAYTKITEVAEMNLTTLLANLGGQFGLFLGKLVAVHLSKLPRKKLGLINSILLINLLS